MAGSSAAHSRYCSSRRSGGSSSQVTAGVIRTSRRGVLLWRLMARRRWHVAGRVSPGVGHRVRTVEVMADLLRGRGRFALAGMGAIGLAMTACTSPVQAAASAHGKATAGAARQPAGQQLWVRRHSMGSANAVAVSPAGGSVFAAGTVTIGYSAATGARLWVSRYGGPAKVGSVANAVTVSPDGSRVFVSGVTWNAQRHPEYATVAYDASTGKQLWASVQAGQAAGGAPAAAEARAIVVSPDGKVVFVTGFSGHA